MMEESILDDLDDDIEVPTGPDLTEAKAQLAKDNASFRQVRGALKKSEKERESLQAKVDELSAIVRERDERDAKVALTSAGFDDRQAEVFRKAYGEATPENIALFEEVLGKRATTPDMPTFAPTSLTGGETSVQSISRTQFEKMMRDPNEQALASRYAENGLVDWNRTD